MESPATVHLMSMMRLYRVIVPVGDLEPAVRFYSTLFGESGIRVSAGRHYFSCGDVTQHPVHRQAGVTSIRTEHDRDAAMRAEACVMMSPHHTRPTPDVAKEK